MWLLKNNDQNILNQTLYSQHSLMDKPCVYIAPNILHLWYFCTAISCYLYICHKTDICDKIILADNDDQMWLKMIFCLLFNLLSAVNFEIICVRSISVHWDRLLFLREELKERLQTLIICDH